MVRMEKLPLALRNCSFCGGSGLKLVSTRESGGLLVHQLPCECVRWGEIRMMPVIWIPQDGDGDEDYHRQNQHLLTASSPTSRVNWMAWGNSGDYCHLIVASHPITREVLIKHLL